MKIGKNGIALLIVMINIIVSIVVIPTWFQDNIEYDEALEIARFLYEENLCVKAIRAYEEAIDIEDTLSIRIEMVDVYLKGIENGEFSSMYSIERFLNNTINIYRNDSEAYEYIGQFFFDRQMYEDCVTTIKQAEKLGVKSEKINHLINLVRYKYERTYSMYLGIIQAENGYYTVCSEDYSILTPKLKSAISGRYKFASPFSSSYALVKTDEQTFLISSDGVRQTYFDNNIDNSTGVGNDLLACRINDKYSYYNINGEYMFGNFLYAGRFRNNIAAVQDEHGWKLINTNENYLTETVFEDIKLNKLGDCAARGMIFAKTNGKYKLYDTNIEQKKGFECDDADLFVTDEWAAFKSGDKWGFVDKEGTPIIEPKYEEARSFSNGLAGVKINGKWNFINNEEKITISEEFDDVDYFNEYGICFVKRGIYWSSISLFYREK